MNRKQSKVAIISIHPSPYRDNIMKELSNICDIIYYYNLDKGHKEWKWKIPLSDYTILLKGLKLINNDILSLDLIPLLMKKKYKLIIIPGYSRINSIICIIYSIIKKIPFILSLDTIYENNRNLIKVTLVKYLYKKSSAFWVPGKASRDFLIKKCGKKKLIIEGCYCIDPIARAHRIFDFQSINKKLKTDDLTFKFLCVGNMIKNRKFKLLVDVIGNLKDKSISLLLIGDGPERREIENICIKYNYSNIIILGPISYHELYYYYKYSNAYIYLGGEPFSTAMEYAAKSGLPIITSNQAGFSDEIDDIELKKLFIFENNTIDINKTIFELINNYNHYKQRANTYKNILILRRNSKEYAKHLMEIINQII